jgi:hypothetical protein
LARSSNSSFLIDHLKAVIELFIFPESALHVQAGFELLAFPYSLGNTLQTFNVVKSSRSTPGRIGHHLGIVNLSRSLFN